MSATTTTTSDTSSTAPTTSAAGSTSDSIASAGVAPLPALIWPAWAVIFGSFAFAIGFATVVHLLRVDPAARTDRDMEEALIQFMTYEKFDVMSDILSAVGAHLSGDLAFADDEGYVKGFVFGSCAVSFCLFALERYLYSSTDEVMRQALGRMLPFLQLVHLCVEDGFQAMLYLFAAASQKAASSGKGIAALLGVLQAAYFAGQRAQEVLGCCQDRGTRGVVVSASERAALVAGRGP